MAYFHRTYKRKCYKKGARTRKNIKGVRGKGKLQCGGMEPDIMQPNIITNIRQKGKISKSPKRNSGSKSPKRNSGSKSPKRNSGSKSPKKSSGSPNICAICLEKLNDTDDMADLPCAHKFHQTCIIEICEHKSNHNVLCPLCRGDITQKCKSINPIEAFVNKYLDLGEYGEPTYSMAEYRTFNAARRHEIHKVNVRYKKNFMARRRRAMENETPQQLAQRAQIEQTSYEDRARSYEAFLRRIHPT